MSKLAIIATLYGQRSLDNAERLSHAVRRQVREQDELWLMYEGDEGFRAALEICGPVAGACIPVEVATPRDANGQYAIIPYSAKINHALDRTEADYIAYLTDDSWPAPEKYERMAAALDENPEWGAVYCAQDYGDAVRPAVDVMHDAHCKVDHTQVMHRLTADRWPLDMTDITVGDAIFWRRLHASLGAFYPVNEVLDFVRQTKDGISAGHRG